MKMIYALLFFGILAGLNSHAQTPTREAVWDTKNAAWLTPEEAAAQIALGTIVVFGEEHATKQNQNDKANILHHANQLRWLKWISARAHALGGQSRLGMEFLEYPQQQNTDDYLANKLSEVEFLTRIRWGSGPFQPYNLLMLESARSGGTIALNIPREISRKVAKSGPDSLDSDEIRQLPLFWERGQPAYFERFKEIMGGHVTEAQLENYFWAQSLWDSTMAWTATKNARPSDITTIVVGAFHAEFGHGLPFQLWRYGATRTKTILQTTVQQWTPAELETATLPDAKYGARADYIWVYLVD